MNLTQSMSISGVLNGAGGAVSAALLKPANRTFSIAGAIAGDAALLQGSTDQGASYQNVQQTINGSLVNVSLTQTRPEITIDDNCDHYRFVRTGVGPGSTMSSGGFVGEQINSAFGGASVFVHWSVDVTADGFSALGAGVKTFTKTLLLGSEIPAGFVLDKVIADTASFIAFNDAVPSNPATTVKIGDTVHDHTVMAASNVGSTGTGQPVAGTQLTLVQLGEFAALDLKLVLVCANDLNTLTVGHYEGRIVGSLPQAI